MPRADAGSGKQQRATSPQPPSWDRSPLFRKLVLAVIFWAVFMVLDRLSLAFQMLGGTPAWYLPAGLNWALVLGVGIEFTPAVFVAAITGALWNYQRSALAWTVVPGNLALCLTYAAGAFLLRDKWRFGRRLERLRDIGRLVVVLLAIGVVGALVGVWAELADGLLSRADFFRGTFDWWVSDAISIVSFTPFLLLYLAPWARSWTKGQSSRTADLVSKQPVPSSRDILEQVLQFVSIALAVWLVFGFAPAARYHPFYILFVPVVWIAVRRGLRRTTLAVFIINAAVMAAAQLVHTENAALPGLQLLMLALGLTALCVGAVVSESMRTQQALAESEERYRGLFEAESDAILVLERGTCRILDANAAALKLYGYSREDFLSLTAGEISAEPGKTRAAIADRQTHVELRLHRKNDGTVFPVEITGNHFVNQGCEINVAAIRDITERRRAERNSG